MKVLVDTSVWSLAFRRKEKRLNELEEKIINELAELINETRAVLIGPIRQEILSGINSKNQFKQLKQSLRAFIDLNIEAKDYEKAAEFFTLCRAKGIQGSHIDLLICSVAFNHNLSIFTTDNDFKYYSEHIDIKLHETRNS